MFPSRPSSALGLAHQQLYLLPDHVTKYHLLSPLSSFSLFLFLYQQSSQAVYKRLGEIFGAAAGSTPDSASTADAACYASYLESKREHQRLMSIYYKVRQTTLFATRQEEPDERKGMQGGGRGG